MYDLMYHIVLHHTMFNIGTQESFRVDNDDELYDESDHDC